MNRIVVRSATRVFAIAFLAIGIGLFSSIAPPASAQDHPPCVNGVTPEVLGNALPDDAQGLALVSVRLTIEPGGGFGAHMHPGTLVVSIDSGELAFTQLDHAGMEMTVNRAAIDGTPTPSEIMIPNDEVILNPGDWLVEPGNMVHMAYNQGSEPTVVLLAGLLTPGAPLVECVDADSL